MRLCLARLRTFDRFDSTGGGCGGREGGGLRCLAYQGVEARFGNVFGDICEGQIELVR
jgi:hypothetical protein